jgi:hypothetical protein
MQSKTLTASGYITADGVKGTLKGFIINGGATDGRIELRDGGSSGDILVSQGISANGNITIMFNKNDYIEFSNDIYALFVGGAASINCFYDSGGN